MSITLGTVTLPDDLVWKDEFDFTVVNQTQTRSLTGALIVQEAVKVKGQPITLYGDQNSGWIDRSTLKALKLLSDSADTNHTLTFHGDTYTVKFDRQGGSPIVAKPIIECTDPLDTDWYSLSLKLITV